MLPERKGARDSSALACACNLKHEWFDLVVTSMHWSNDACVGEAGTTARVDAEEERSLMDSGLFERREERVRGRRMEWMMLRVE